MRQLSLSLISFYLLTSSQTALASFPEFFGSATTTSSIGNQANQDSEDPANLYYVPALTGWANKIVLSAQSSATSVEVDDITNIVTENSTNGQTGTATETGNANTSYGESYSTAIHAILPLRDKDFGALGLSFFAPIGRLAETNSGNPRLPEYSLYRARYKRTQIHANYALPLNENWALSVGAHMGFQISARVNTQVSLSNNYGSSGSAKTKINPSLGGIFSLAYKNDDSLGYFTFQQEMKSNLEAIATGDISNPPLTLINVGLDNMVYYDPHIFRLGYIKSFERLSLALSAEYQLWENYEPPTITVRNLGGTVKASQNFDSLALRNVFVPKIGLRFSLSDKTSLSGGAFYRQSPFDSDFSGGGNTIDTDVLGLTTGLSHEITIFSKAIEVGGAFQYHHLVEKTVTKTANQEDGSSGQKIGAPGYTIGGRVLMATAGLRIKF